MQSPHHAQRAAYGSVLERGTYSRPSYSACLLKKMALLHGTMHQPIWLGRLAAERMQLRHTLSRPAQGGSTARPRAIKSPCKLGEARGLKRQGQPPPAAAHNHSSTTVRAPWPHAPSPALHVHAACPAWASSWWGLVCPIVHHPHLLKCIP